MSYARPPASSQPVDERSGRYAVDQHAETEVGLDAITEQRAERVLATGVLVLSCVCAALLVVLVIVHTVARG